MTTPRPQPQQPPDSPPPTPRWVVVLGVATVVLIVGLLLLGLLVGGDHGPGRHG